MMMVTVRSSHSGDSEHQTISANNPTMLEIHNSTTLLLEVVQHRDNSESPFLSAITTVLENV